MAQDIHLGVVLKADGSDLVGEVRVSRREIDKLGRGLKDTAGDARTAERRLEQMNRRLRDMRDRARGAIGVMGRLSAVVAAGGVLLAKQFIDAAREAENFRVRLNTLLGSVAEGNRAFEEMAEFAGTVPFEYRDIMSAATQLSGVLEGGVDEIKQYMPVIADLAAVSGLSIEETTSQVIRMYSAGAASADMFRERGILAMLGFQAGVSYSAEETRRQLIGAWEAADSQFRGATEDLAKNWDGIMSMMSDSWFQFRDRMMEDTVLWDFFKTALGDFQEQWADTLDANQSTLDRWADDTLGVIETVSVGFGHLGDFLDVVANGIDSIRTGLITVEQGAINLSSVLSQIKHYTSGGFMSEEATSELERTLLENETELQRLRGEAHGIAANMIERANRDLSSEVENAFRGIEKRAREAFNMRELNADIEALVSNNNELFASAMDVGGAYEGAAGGIGKTGDAAGDAADQVLELSDAFKTAVGETEQYLGDVDKRIEGVIDATRTEREQIEITRQERIDAIEDAARVGRIEHQEAADLRRRVDQAYSQDKLELERKLAGDVGLVWKEMAEDARQTLASNLARGATQAVRDEIIEEKRAKDRAKELLNDRLEDLQEQLREGNISKAEALEKREELYEDYRDRIAEIDKSIGDRLKETLIDSLATAIDKMMSMWLESGIMGLLSGEGLSGFTISGAFGSDDSGGGNDAAGMAVNKMFTEGVKKGWESFKGTEMGQTVAGWFGQGQVTSGMTQAQATQVLTSGSAYGGGTAATSGMTGAQATQALTSGAAYGGTTAVTSGMTGAQATQVLTSQAAYGGGTTAAGGSAAAGSSAGWGAMGAAAAPLALFAVGMHNTSIPTSGEIALGNFNRGLAPDAPFGLRQTQARDKQFAFGDTAGFATEFARSEGVEAGKSRGTRDLGRFNLESPEQLTKLLERAEKKYEDLKAAAASTFELGENGAARVGEALKDGVINQTELAELGFIRMGEQIVNARTGAVSLGDVTAGQFDRIIAAVTRGEIRMGALTGKVQITQGELEVLGKIGLDVSGNLAAGAGNAANAFRAIGSAINAIPSEKTVTIRERRLGFSSSGGDERGGKSFAIGTPFVPHDMDARIHFGEKIIDAQSSRILERYGIKVGAGGTNDDGRRGRRDESDGETKALLRSIDGKLSRLERLDSLSREITEPLVQSQDRASVRSDLKERARRRRSGERAA